MYSPIPLLAPATMATLPSTAMLTCFPRAYLLGALTISSPGRGGKGLGAATARRGRPHEAYMDHKAPDPKAGRPLVAPPLLGHPNLKRAVVLIVEHEDVQG